MKYSKTLVPVLLLATSNASFAAVFTDPSAFFANAGGLELESFETLPVTNSFDSTILSLPEFEITTNAKMGVYSGLPGNGTHPTNGSAFIHHFLSGTDSFIVTFTFATSITAFGLTTTDLASPIPFIGEYTMTTNAGDELLITDNVEQDGAELFSGIVNVAGFTSVSLKGPLQGDAFGIDGVYYSEVPAPAAAWLFGSALLGLGAVKSKKA